MRQTDQVVDQVPHVQVVERTGEIPQLLSDVLVFQVQVAAETVEIPQSLSGQKIAMIPEVRTVQGTQTSESFCEFLMRGVAPNTETDSCIDDLISVGSRELSRRDCEVLSHAGMKRITQQPDSGQQQQQDNQPQGTRQSTRQEGEKERRERKKERK